MSTSGEAAEQVVRMSLSGVEVAARITGTGAKELATLLYAILKNQEKTKGKTRLSSMIKSGKELKVFAIKDDELGKFAKEAKKYGVLYCVLKNKDDSSHISDIMVRAEDASKVNRIFERFSLSTVNVADITTELERAAAAASEIPPAEKTEASHTRNEQPNKEEAQTENPTEARVAKSQSAHSSEISRKSHGSTDPGHRKSVRIELAEIRAEAKANAERIKVPVRISEPKER